MSANESISAGGGVDENEQCRNVYAHYGVAMFYAQVIEEGLVTLTAMSQYPLTRADVDKLYSEGESQTLGRLLRELAKRLTWSPTVTALFGDARASRNWLAHHFFRERAVEFMTEAGRRQMIDELTQATERFQYLNAHISGATLALGKPYGVTKSAVDQCMEDMLA